MKSLKKRVHVSVISDASGFTAERVIRTVLVQFRQDIDPVIRRHAFIRDVDTLKDLLIQAQEQQALVIYSLVDNTLRDFTVWQSSVLEIECLDLMGPLLQMMIRRFNVNPVMMPGMLEPLNENSLKLAEAIDFTLNHDDGQRQETLGLSDVIIIGVSRTSKTPTSLYLACHYCLKVSNVPIVLDMDPPEKLFRLKKPRIIGLTITRDRLMTIRRGRFQTNLVGGYTELDMISRELSYCHKVFSRIKGLKIIDVTHNTIEDTSMQIMRQ